MRSSPRQKAVKKNTPFSSNQTKTPIYIMKRKMKCLIGLLAFFLSCTGLAAQTFDENGFGTDDGGNTIYQPATLNGDNAYEIGNAGQLFWFAGLVNGTLDGVAQNKAANAVLTTDIDMSGVTGWLPIAGKNNYAITHGESDSNLGYLGVFDGQGHVISNLTFEAKGFGNRYTYGLFGSVAGEIRRVGVDNFTCTTTDEDWQRVGALAGMLEPGAKMTGCFAMNITINLPQLNAVGSLVGGNYGGKIEGCYTYNCTGYTANQQGGELVGANDTSNNLYPGLIKHCAVQSGLPAGTDFPGQQTDNLCNLTTEQLASGEVCWLLNGKAAGETWRQNLGGETADARPVLNQEHAKVYGSYDALGSETYSNDANKVFASIPTLADGAYQIANDSELRWFAGLVNGTLDGVAQNTAANAVITDDIDLNPGITFSLSERVAGGTPMEWTPMGSESQPYTGTFDGQSHTIKGMAFTTTQNNSGFFGYLGEGADVKHFTMDNFLIQAENVERIGAIAGYAQAATLTDILVTGEGGILCTPAKTASRIGGLVGRAQRITIGNCQNDCDIIGNGGFYVGGIIGETRNHSQITNCANYGSLSNVGQYCGGITPMLSSHCSIADCVNEGHITDVKGGNCGGVVGVLEYSSTMTRCQNKGNINQVAELAGGVVGVLRGAENTGDAGSEITYCVNSGNISTQKDAGGLVALLLRGAQVSYSINLGNVSGASNSSDCIGGGRRKA